MALNRRYKAILLKAKMYAHPFLTHQIKQEVAKASDTALLILAKEVAIEIDKRGIQL